MAEEGAKKPGTFEKGDPRINRKGRPKSFDALRELAQGISHEAAKSGGQELVIDGHIATVAEAILRQWAQSKDPRLQMAFVEVAFGKAPVQATLTHKFEAMSNDELIQFIEKQLAGNSAGDSRS